MNNPIYKVTIGKCKSSGIGDEYFDSYASWYMDELTKTKFIESYGIDIKSDDIEEANYFDYHFQLNDSGYVGLASIGMLSNHEIRYPSNDLKIRIKKIKASFTPSIFDSVKYLNKEDKDKLYKALKLNSKEDRMLRTLY